MQWRRNNRWKNTTMPAHTSSITAAQLDRTLAWRYIFAGLCASLVSIGLARFGYTPLIPALIQAHWFSTSAIIYLGSANLAGYLVGALIGRPISSRLPNEHILRLMMVLITATFVACAFPLSVSWFFCWRFLSGVAGGVVMVLVAATVMPHVPPARKGVAGGAIFLGLGLGIAASGTLIPLLLNFGLQQTWIGMAVLSAVLTAASWFAWPSSRLGVAGQTEAGAHAPAHPRFSPSINLLYGQYALMVTACVPPMVFIVDFIARGLGAGTYMGSLFWILYGLGAIIGPPLYGLLADRMGAQPAMRLVVIVQAVALASVHVVDGYLPLGILTVVIGTFAPGIVPLTLARVNESIPHNRHRQNIVWSRATTISAAFMAGSGYAFSAIFNVSGSDYRLLFLIAAILLVLALLIDAIGAFGSGRNRSHAPAAE
jgi:predicted MFS family arabinose efflux permease